MNFEVMRIYIMGYCQADSEYKPIDIPVNSEKGIYCH